MNPSLAPRPVTSTLREEMGEGERGGGYPPYPNRSPGGNENTTNPLLRDSQGVGDVKEYFIVVVSSLKEGGEGIYI